MRTKFIRGLLLVAVLAETSSARASRLKELVDVEGVRTNQLTGLGLVVGLTGTGDDFIGSAISRRQLALMANHLGINIDPKDIIARNVATVVVTANLPPFARPGTAIDVHVSAASSAKSLLGGTLVATPLKGADKAVYALAQGPVAVGGFAVEGATGSSARKNHVTVARIPGGATVEREAPGALPKKELVLLLRDADFTTASRIAEAVNKAVGEKTARVRDPGSVVVAIGKNWQDRVVEYVASLEAIEATPDAPARVVIDERTGTIVVGAKVTLGPAAIASGGITVTVQEKKEVSQPQPLSPGGTTQVVPETQVNVEEKEGMLRAVAGAATVDDVANALNALGVKPRDLVAIFQALKMAGALRADITVM